MKRWGAMFRKSDILWKQGHFYRKSLVIVLVISCLPTLLVGIGVNWIGVSQLESNVVETRVNQVNQSVLRLDDSLTQLEKNATQWAFNQVLGMKLLDLLNFYDYEHIREIFKTLFLLKNSNPLVDEAYLYLDDVHGNLYSDEGGVVVMEEEAERSRFRALLAQPHTTYWLPSFGRFKPAQNGSSPALIYQLPVENGKPVAALIIFLNKGKLLQTIGESFSDGLGSFLMSKNGEWIVTSNAKEPSSWEEELKQAVLAQGNRSGTFSYQGQGEDYSVSYSTFNRLGSNWIYVSIASLSKMTSPIVFASRLIYAVSIGGLLAGIIIAILASRKLYEPIRYLTGLFRINRKAAGFRGTAVNEIEFIEKEWKQLMLESESLHELAKRQLPRLREGFLLQLVQGHYYSWTEAEVRQHMQQLGWEMEKSSIAVVLIQLHGVAKLSGRFLEGDRQLISYATSNIIEEAAKSRFPQAEVINFQDLTAGLFLIVPEEYPPEQVKEELNKLAEQLTNVLESIIRMGITVCIGRRTSRVTHIPTVLEETRHTIKNRSIADSRSILDVEDNVIQEPVPVQYPFVLEAELIQAIRAGQPEESLDALERFCYELRQLKGTQSMFTQYILQLLGNVQFGYLKGGYDPYKHAAAANLHVELAGISEPDDAIVWFQNQIIIPYTREVQRLVSTRNEHQKLLIEQMVDLLQRSYHTDISLESCADQYGVNPFTLSRIFKQETGVNFIDYLTELRMVKSKQLLTETDYKINEIAGQVGYQPTYFNRIFKKYEGISPSRYRQLYYKS